MNRRTFLRWMLTAGGVAAMPGWLHEAAPGQPPRHLRELMDDLRALLDGRAIGFDLRHMNERGEEYFRVQVNQDALYPTASCFKLMLVLYYLWHTPQNQWHLERGSIPYSVAVYSNNMRTGELLQAVGERIDIYGNAVEKFNDFLLFELGLRNGLYRWNWPGNPVEGQLDRRFAPSYVSRYVQLGYERYVMDNLTTAEELADVYALLLQPHSSRQPMLDAMRELFSIPAEDYDAPIERAFDQLYTGKDGVIPSDASMMGRIINDAGIIRVGNNLYVLSYLCAGEGEFVGMTLLGQVAERLRDYRHGEGIARWRSY